MIGVPTKPLPHVARRVGVVGHQGTQIVDEQPPQVRLHDRARELERPIQPDRLEQEQHGGVGVDDRDRPTVLVERQGEKPQGIREESGPLDDGLPVLPLRPRQLAEIHRPSGSRGKLTSLVATGLRVYAAACRVTYARLVTSRWRWRSSSRNVRLRAAGTRWSLK